MAKPWGFLGDETISWKVGERNRVSGYQVRHWLSKKLSPWGSGNSTILLIQGPILTPCQEGQEEAFSPFTTALGPCLLGS